MNRRELFLSIVQKKSFLCIGLDTEWSKIPEHLLSESDPVFAFNKAIIDATRDLCVAYKPNTAFYEALGAKGWRSLEKTIRYIGSKHFVIADAKRGDIGNTSRLYATAFFEKMPACSAVTVAPYMGRDSVAPFLEFQGKWAVVLGLTSNAGSADFQQLHLSDGVGEQPLFEQVLTKVAQWGSLDNLMFVVGATHPESFREVRRIVPYHFLLVPGVGSQGGDLHAVCQYGLNDTVGLLVNASRSIIYAGNGLDFAELARKEALKMQQAMAEILDAKYVQIKNKEA